MANNNRKNEFIGISSAITIVNQDAKSYLLNLCYQGKDYWNKHRAVLFLDPFGMQIPWETIKAIAKTEAIDLWYLFPLGVAVNRLLTRDGNIKESLKRRLSEIFGTADWFDAFYTTKRQQSQHQQLSLFEDSTQDSTQIKKTANYESISQYFVKRLKEEFALICRKSTCIT